MTDDRSKQRVRMVLRDEDQPGDVLSPREAASRYRDVAAVSGSSYRRWLTRTRLLGLALVLAGGVYAVGGFLPSLQRGQNDAAARASWDEVVARPLAVASGIPAGTPEAPASGALAPLPGGMYARISFPRIGESAVMGNGNWDVLHSLSAVHWDATPAFGQKGNAVVAMHREFSFKRVDELKPGDEIDVQDRSGKTWKYRLDRVRLVTKGPQGWDTSDLEPVKGENALLTAVTCTPWLVDSARLVFRGSLLVGQ